MTQHQQTACPSPRPTGHIQPLLPPPVDAAARFSWSVLCRPVCAGCPVSGRTSFTRSCGGDLTDGRTLESVDRKLKCPACEVAVCVSRLHGSLFVDFASSSKREMGIDRRWQVNRPRRRQTVSPRETHLVTGAPQRYAAAAFSVTNWCDKDPAGRHGGGGQGGGRTAPSEPRQG